MAGDLMPGMEAGVRWLINRIPNHPIIYIAGNHEAYGADIDSTIEAAKAEAAGTNVHVMQDEAIVIGGIRFVCATLWTDFSLLDDPQQAMAISANLMNDFRMIRVGKDVATLLHPIDTLERHKASRAFIEAELNRPFNGRTVVITHHGPYRGAVRRGLEAEIKSTNYASDLEPLIAAAGPDLWVYGHTHKSDDTMLGRTRLISNAKGYGPWYPQRQDNSEFNPVLVVEV